MLNNLTFLRIVVKLKKGVSREEFEEGKIRQFFGKFGDVVKFEATVDISISVLLPSSTPKARL